MESSQMPTPHQLRKKWKTAAAKTVKGHYLILVAVCLIAVFIGTEFAYIRTSAENMITIVSGENVEVGGDELKLDVTATRRKVYLDIVEDNLAAGREKAARQMEEYHNEKMTDTIAGRRYGVLASMVNNFTSGTLYLEIFGSLHSMVHSSTAAVMLFVGLHLLLIVLVWVFVKNLYGGILRRIFLEARTYSEVPVGHMLHFRLVGRWARASLTLLLRSVLLSLWAMTVVGYFIKRYSYYMVPYLVAEDPDIRPLEAIRLSRGMMNGHKWECFKLEASFLPWMLLGVVTFDISEVLWSLPYRLSTYTEFYAERRREAKERQLPGSDRMNDVWLFEHADEAMLRRTYNDIEEQKRFIDENRVTLPKARAFAAKNLGLWIGGAKEKIRYDEVDDRRKQIVEERAVIKGRIYPQRLNPLWRERAFRIALRTHYLRTYTIWSVIMIFFVFSLVGWGWEVGIHLMGDGVFVNRGMLHGPWLPIYGGGVLVILLLLARFRNRPLLEAVSIVVLCGVVEFSASYMMEMTQGMRWWDYTGYFLNLNGRICGEGLIVFAIGGLAAVYLLAPILDAMFSRIPAKVLTAVCIVLLVCFLGDLVYSQIHPNAGDGITDYSAYEETAAELSGDVFAGAAAHRAKKAQKT